MIKIVRPNITHIKSYLEERRKQIERHIVRLRSEDPFADTARLSDNAASDTDAREEVGHERVEALKSELSASLAIVKRALAKIGIGSYGICDNCKKPIAPARLKVFPMAEYCLACEEKIEKGK